MASYAAYRSPKRRPQRLDRQIGAEHAAPGTERLDHAVQPRSKRAAVPRSEDRADGVNASCDTAARRPPGAAMSRWSRRPASDRSSGQPKWSRTTDSPGNRCARSATSLISLAARLDGGDQPLIGQQSDGLGQPVGNVRRRGRRAGPQCRDEPDAHARHQGIPPQRRHQRLEPGVGRVGERYQADHLPSSVLSGNPSGRRHRISRTSVGPDDTPYVESRRSVAVSSANA